MASNYCSTKPVFETISKILKIIFNAVESFHNKSLFYSGYKKFWVAQNYFPIATKLNTFSVKKKAKSISTFDFSTLYTTIPYKLLLNVLSEVINLAFKSKVRKRIGFSKASIYWTSKEAGRTHFTKQTLVKVVSFLINKCFFTLLVTRFLGKILVCQLVLTQPHFKPILHLFLGI